MIRTLISLIRRAFPPSIAQQQQVPQPPPELPVAAPATASTSPAATGRRGRPLSSTLTKTVTLLGQNPSLTPAELARQLKVTPSYARTLLRRARNRAPEPEEPAVRMAPVAPVQQQAASAILERLQTAESEIRELRAARPSARQRWDLSRRAEVIRRGLAGENPSQIAASLHVPQGEVCFILKVQKLLMQAH